MALGFFLNPILSNVIWFPITYVVVIWPYFLLSKHKKYTEKELASIDQRYKGISFVYPIIWLFVFILFFIVLDVYTKMFPSPLFWYLIRPICLGFVLCGIFQGAFSTILKVFPVNGMRFYYEQGTSIRNIGLMMLVSSIVMGVIIVISMVY